MNMQNSLWIVALAIVVVLGGFGAIWLMLRSRRAKPVPPLPTEW